jgi:hypothetical protein
LKKNDKLSHAYVTFLDLPEALPFGIPVTEGDSFESLDLDGKIQDAKSRELFKFIKIVESKFGERTCYIGEDVIGEKFYKRFLFENGGFVEIMTGIPVAISAHFTALPRAKKFATAVSAAIKSTVRNPKLREILVSSITADQEEDNRLTYQTWSKLRTIREGV